jgi:hypothetical protein
MKLRWLVVLLLVFGTAGAASRTEKLQVVYRGEEGGPWRMYIFGASCEAPAKVKVVSVSDSSQPLEIECSGRETK